MQKQLLSLRGFYPDDTHELYRDSMTHGAQGRNRWRSALWVALLLAAVGASFAFSATPEERSLFQFTNQARAQQGLQPLNWDETLAQAARVHASWVVQSGQLSHQYSGEPDVTARAAQAGAHFQTIAENIAVGPSSESIQSQWMKSPPHRANILNPALNAVGFAVVQRGQSLYAVADFDRSVPNPTMDQVKQTVDRLLAAQGIQTTAPSQDARQTCEMSHGSAGGSAPLFIMRWQTSELSQLPGALQDRLRSGQYRTAAVGACSSANAESGFTSYRIAVLLY